MSRTLLFNGRGRTPDLSRSRALHYGDGVFRTCLVDDYRVLDLARHLRTLAADARALDLVPPPARLLGREARALAAGHRRAVLKLVLFRAGQGRGYAPATDRADRLLLVSPAPAYPPAHWDRGIRLASASLRLAAQGRLAGIKHLNRLEQVLASASTPAGVDEVLLSDARGRPVSGARSNLFWVRRGRLHTPSLEQCGVAGQMRAKLLELARRLGIPARTHSVPWRTLLQADEVFVCNSLVGIWPVQRLGRRRWAAPGPVTTRLMARLKHPRLEAR